MANNQGNKNRTTNAPAKGKNAAPVKGKTGSVRNATTNAKGAAAKGRQNGKGVSAKSKKPEIIAYTVLGILIVAILVIVIVVAATASGGSGGTVTLPCCE